MTHLQKFIGAYPSLFFGFGWICIVLLWAAASVILLHTTIQFYRVFLSSVSYLWAVASYFMLLMASCTLILWCFLHWVPRFWAWVSGIYVHIAAIVLCFVLSDVAWRRYGVSYVTENWIQDLAETTGVLLTGLIGFGVIAFWGWSYCAAIAGLPKHSREYRCLEQINIRSPQIALALTGISAVVLHLYLRHNPAPYAYRAESPLMAAMGVEQIVFAYAYFGLWMGGVMWFGLQHQTFARFWAMFALLCWSVYGVLIAFVSSAGRGVLLPLRTQDWLQLREWGMTVAPIIPWMLFGLICIRLGIVWGEKPKIPPK
ncbi:MAG: hypothetical protein AAF701_06155 [Pseudomonadota bacterium]